MNNIFYIATSNGDYNEEVINAGEVSEWELNEGSQKFVIVTKKKLTEKQYSEISKILEGR